MDYQLTNNAPYTIEEILMVDDKSFKNAAINIFHFQYEQNNVYRKWINQCAIENNNVQSVANIPFLPISFFKTHSTKSGDFNAELIFTSSGTTGIQPSTHYVYSSHYYKKSFLKTFELFYGNVKEHAIIGLLPSYLEKGNSSLVYMVEHLIRLSDNPDSGLYLYDFKKLYEVLKRREAAKQKTWLIGVTYALLDFAEQFQLPLQYTYVVETGGMKGRKKEMVRGEVHQILMQAFQNAEIGSEYGMTELLSQAYSKKAGIFHCPPWMKVLVREEDDPFALKAEGTGMLCVIDLANIFSCSFIATEDVGKVYTDGSFEVLGRVDNSEIRGCSLLTI